MITVKIKIESNINSSEEVTITNTISSALKGLGIERFLLSVEKLLVSMADLSERSLLHLESRFEDVVGKKVLFIKASGSVQPHESMSEWQEVEKQLEGLVDGAAAVVINLAEVNYVDSIGMGTAVTFYNFLKRRGVILIFTNLPSTIAHKFQTTKLNDVFTIAADEKQATALIKKQNGYQPFFIFYLPSSLPSLTWLV